MMKSFFNKKTTTDKAKENLANVERESKMIDDQEQIALQSIEGGKLSSETLFLNLEKQQLELSEKRENLKGLNKQVSSIKAQLKETQAHHSKVATEKNSVEGQIAQSKISIDKLEYELKKLEEETSDNQKSHQQALRLVEELSKKSIQLDWEIKNSKGNLEVAQLKFSTQDILSSKLQKDVLSLESQKSNIKNEIDVLKVKIERLSEVVASNHSYRETLLVELNKLASFKTSREEKFKKVTEKNISLNISIEDIKDRITDLKEPIDILESKINKISATIEEQTSDLNLLEKDYESSRETKTSKESFLARQEHSRHVNKKKTIRKTARHRKDGP